MLARKNDKLHGRPSREDMMRFLYWRGKREPKFFHPLVIIDDDKLYAKICAVFRSYFISPQRAKSRDWMKVMTKTHPRIIFVDETVQAYVRNPRMNLRFMTNSYMVLITERSGKNINTTSDMAFVDYVLPKADLLNDIAPLFKELLRYAETAPRSEVEFAKEQKRRAGDREELALYKDDHPERRAEVASKLRERREAAAIHELKMLLLSRPFEKLSSNEQRRFGPYRKKATALLKQKKARGLDF